MLEEEIRRTLGPPEPSIETETGAVNQVGNEQGAQMREWTGQADPSATTRLYLKIESVEAPLPYPQGAIRLHSSTASSSLPKDRGVHTDYPYFLEISGLRYVDARLALGNALHTCLLWCDTAIGVGPGICHDNNGTSVFGSDSPNQILWGHSDEQLPSTALEAINVFGPIVHQINRESAFDPFANALRLYVAGLAMTPSDVALVSFVSALEGLFTTTGDSISYRFSLAIAGLLETDRERRKEVMHEAKDLYSVRSKTVHGTKLSRDKERIAISLAESYTPRAEHLCRRSLRRLLETGLADFVSTDSNGRRGKFFTLLVLGYSLQEVAQEMDILLSPPV